MSRLSSKSQCTCDVVESKAVGAENVGTTFSHFNSFNKSYPAICRAEHFSQFMDCSPPPPPHTHQSTHTSRALYLHVSPTHCQGSAPPHSSSLIPPHLSHPPTLHLSHTLHTYTLHIPLCLPNPIDRADVPKGIPLGKPSTQSEAGCCALCSKYHALCKGYGYTYATEQCELFGLILTFTPTPGTAAFPIVLDHFSPHLDHFSPMPPPVTRAGLRLLTHLSGHVLVGC